MTQRTASLLPAPPRESAPSSRGLRVLVCTLVAAEAARDNSTGGVFRFLTKTNFTWTGSRWRARFFVEHARSDLELRGHSVLDGHAWEPPPSHLSLECHVTSLALDPGGGWAYWINGGAIFRQQLFTEPAGAVQRLWSGGRGSIKIYTASPASWFDERLRRLYWFTQVTRVPSAQGLPDAPLAPRLPQRLPFVAVNFHAVCFFPLDEPDAQPVLEYVLDGQLFVPSGGHHASTLRTGRPVRVGDSGFYFGCTVEEGHRHSPGAWGDARHGGICRYRPGEAPGRASLERVMPERRGSISGLAYDGARLHACDVWAYVYTVDLDAPTLEEAFRIDHPRPPDRATTFTCSGLAYNPGNGLMYVSYRMSTGEGFISAYNPADPRRGLLQRYLAWSGEHRQYSATFAHDELMAIAPGEARLVEEPVYQQKPPVISASRLRCSAVRAAVVLRIASAILGRALVRGT